MFTSVSRGNEGHGAYRFGDFVIDLDRASLSSGGREISLRPKSFAVLLHLVRNQGRVVGREELLQSVWGHTHVTEDSLTQCLIDIRRALGDEAHEIVRTLPKRGYILEPEVKPADAGVGSKRRYLVVGLITLALFVVGGWWGARHLGYDIPLPGDFGVPAPENSIAVLPFENLSGEQDNEYFADGLTEEILDSLTQVPGLKVIARTSSFALKGTKADIPTIADKLDVAYVMEGSVRRSGGRVRITAQLVDARTDTHVWSRTYERGLGDIFAVQSEIADLVARTLKVSRSGLRTVSIAHSPDPEAYQHFLRGEYFWQRRSPGDRDRAEREFRQAVDLDPEFARAWTALAGAYSTKNLLSDSRDPGWLDRYHDMLEKALAVNPNLAEAHARLSDYYYISGDLVRSDEHWKKAQALDPDSMLVLAYGADIASWHGRYEEAVALARRTTQLDPLSAIAHGNLSAYLLAAGHLEEAESELDQAQELSPDPAQEFDYSLINPRVLIRILQHRYDEALASIEALPEGLGRDQGLALVYSGLGREDDAAEAMARMRAAGGIRSDLGLAEVYAFRGERDRAFKLLESVNARLDVDPRNLVTLECLTDESISPLFIPLRDDPRWRALWDGWRLPL